MLDTEKCVKQSSDDMKHAFMCAFHVLLAERADESRYCASKKAVRPSQEAKKRLGWTPGVSWS